MKRMVLIADDSELDRRLLKTLLTKDYDVLEASNGEEVLSILAQKHMIVSVVLLDIIMPVMDGFQTLQKIREDESYLDLPIIMISSNLQVEVKKQSIEYGANGFLNKPFEPILVYKSIENLIRIRENAALVNSLSTDALTGMMSSTLFFKECDKLVQMHEPGYYVMSCIDIDNFKVINDQYGMEIGDAVIRHVGECLSICYKELGGLACRFYADKFAVLYPAQFTNSSIILNNHKKVISPDCINHSIRVHIGRYVIQDRTIRTNIMFERAAVAEQSLKGRYDVYISEYTDSLLSKILLEQQIVNEMEDALQNGQFVPFLQPQYNHATGALIGAEALVRWKKDGKYISPGEFIPIFEKNGFVYEVDKYIWEQVSILLRKWLDEGKNPLPVSVNISRFDLYKEDFFYTICGLIKKYQLPPDLLRLEVTESAFADSTEPIINMVNRLIDYGFTVEIDDFGSGYSSLNTLKDVPASILKLDMKFFSQTQNSVRSGNIIESVVRMANWLGMSVIAEGVEIIEQADFLKSIGCYYIQGYLYSRPIPVSEYEQLLISQKSETKYKSLTTVTNLDNNLFWDPNSMETLIFNSYVGGACILEQYKGELELLRVNKQFMNELGEIVSDGSDLSRLNPTKYLDEQNSAIFAKTTETAVSSGSEESCELVIGNLSGKKEYVHFTIRLIATAQNRKLFYCVLVNTTKIREIEQQAQITADSLQVVLETAGNGIAVVINHADSNEFVFANEKYYELLGSTKEEYPEIVKKGMMSLVYEEDRETLLKTVSEAHRLRKESVAEFRIAHANNKLIWVKVSSTYTRFKGIEDPVQVFSFANITDEKEANEQLSFLNKSAHDILAQQNENMAIEDTLFKLQHYFRSDRAYVVEVDWKLQVASNTYEVCKSGVSHQKDNFQKVPLSAFEPWIRQLMRGEQVCISGVEESKEYSEKTKEVFRTQGICNLALAPLIKEGRLFGFIGLDNPDPIKQQLDRLRAIGDYFAIMLSRRDLNKKLEQETQAMHFLMEDTPGGFCRMRIHTGQYPEILYANRGFCMLMDMTYDEIQHLYGTSAYNYLHPEDIPHLIESGRNCIKNGGQINVKCRLKKKGGEYLDVMIIGRFSVSKIDEIYLNAYYVDIEDQLQEEVRQKRLLDNLPCGAGLYEYDGTEMRAVYFNKRYWELVNRKPVDYRAMFMRGAIHPDDIELVKQDIKSAVEQNREISCDLRICYAETEYRPFHVNGFVEKTGSSKCMIYTSYEPLDSKDMNFRRMLPIALSTVMKATNDLAYVKDADLRYICCSNSAAQMIGLDNPRDMIGKTDAEFMDASMTEEFGIKDRMIMETGEALINYNEKMILPDNHVVTMQCSKYPIIDSEGKTIGIYGVCHDITKYEDMEFELNTLLRVIPSGILKYSADEKEEIAYVNHNLILGLGYTQEEFTEKYHNCFRELIWKEDRKRAEEEILLQENSGEIGKFNYRIEDAQGNLHWFHDEGVRMVDQQGKAWYYVTLVDVTEQINIQNNLTSMEEKYRLAAQHSGRTIGYYDIAEASITITDEAANRLLIPQKVNDVPYGRLQSGDISKDTQAAYVRFFEDIKRGKLEGNVMFQKMLSNRWRWISAHSTTMYSDSGKAVSALISYIDVTDQYEKDAIYTKWQQSLENRPDNSYSLFRCTLNAEISFDSSEGRLIRYIYHEGQNLNFDECMKGYADKCVISEDRENFVFVLNSSQLKTDYEKNKRRISFEYREEDESGSMRWIRCTADLIERPDAPGIIVYLLFEDIDESKRAELDTITMAETDALTGLLNRNAFVQRLNKAMEECPSDALIALFILDMDGFKSVNDTFGHAAGDQVLIETGRIIRSALWDCDLVGRLGGDEFIFCMVNIPNKEVIRKKVRRIWKLTHRKISDTVSISSSIGIAIWPEEGTTFEELYSVADKALYVIKQNGKDNYGFYQEHFRCK